MCRWAYAKTSRFEVGHLSAARFENRKQRQGAVVATGLAIPVGVNTSGGARLVSGDANNDKVIRLALGDDDNENAFQQNVGLGAGMIFGISDQTQQAKITRRLFEIFRRFEAQKRFILQRNTIKWSSDPTNQTMTLQFKYVDIESEVVKDFDQNFAVSTGSTSGTVRD